MQINSEVQDPIGVSLSRVWLPGRQGDFRCLDIEEQRDVTTARLPDGTLQNVTVLGATSIYLRRDRKTLDLIRRFVAALQEVAQDIEQTLPAESPAIPCVWCGREASPLSERTWCESCEAHVCDACGDEPVFCGDEVCNSCQALAAKRRERRLEMADDFQEKRLDDLRERLADYRAAEAAERAARSVA